MLYIHIPFCKSICSYCDFYHSASLLRVNEVVDCIIDEIDRRSTFISSPIRTIYFGGGTPSVLSIDSVGRILDKVSQTWPTDLLEVTFEVNPEDVTPEYATGLRSLGINRLSMGIQSFCDDHLKLFNRRHDASQAINAVRTAQASGFDNISIDLIYGMPFLTIEQWQSNIDQAVSLGVQHISAYHLTIEPKTVFGKRKLVAVDDATSQKNYDMLCSSLSEAGFEHYEISNFALAGMRSKHNSAYWNGTHYLGVGPSAHSYNGVIRHWNVASNAQYISGNVGEYETLTPTDIYNEQIMTSLRTLDGLDNPNSQLIRRAQRFISNGDLEFVDGRLRIPEKHWLISDYIISELFE